ncbi:MAG: hypothetical protein LBV51_01065 [Acholeplasmatales bacterium]|jgi:hypothetical protein|nr:hypothetical protein [Acholeplasmatales bacterium]
MKTKDNKKQKIEYPKSKTIILSRILYWTFTVVTIVTLLVSWISYFLDRQNIEITLTHTMLCAICILTINIPNILIRKFKLYIPPLIMAIAITMLFLNCIVGEIYRVYDTSIILDRALHFISGFLYGILALSVISLTSNWPHNRLKLSPLFVSIFIICFTFTTGYIWECFEYVVDSLTGAFMQRWNDSFVGIIQDGVFVETTQLPSSVFQSGLYVHTSIRGSGLEDTMRDLLLNIIGAVVTSIFAFIQTKRNPDSLKSYLIMKLDTANNLFGKKKKDEILQEKIVEDTKEENEYEDSSSK